ncbi:MAG TPA: C1 family peptidase, partial [Solirubrobacteraceae bacterium]|nr:C1 family peptidase [Solirubrobacteraceae bacterium]
MAITTFGELRRELIREGITWTVNPNFGDDVTIPRFALGADLTDWPKAETVPRVDVPALVAAAPTTNALLRNHLVERGLLEPLFLGEQRLVGSPGPTAKTGAIARTAGVGGIAPSGGGSAPSMVDWRNRFGWSWITGIRDQDPCEHCWIYSATALVEAMVRIEHCVWCPRSEGDYIEANRVPCGQCGDPGGVLSWVQSNGLADLDCVPWVDRDPGDRSSAYWNPAPRGCGGGSMLAPPAWSPCGNRNGRTVKIPAYTSLGNVADEKHWIDAVGPLVVVFDVYSDFFGWSGNTPYVKSASATYEGSHVVLAVGYDDGLG